MNENHMKNFELDKLSDELYADAPGLDPELEWKEEAVTESPIEEASAKRIGDFMVRKGNEAVGYVGTSTVVVIPEGITKIDSKLMEDFEKEYASWDLDESKLTDPKAKGLYESCCLDIDEALELQRIRTRILKDESK